MKRVNGFERKTLGNPLIVQLLVGIPEINALKEKAELLLGDLHGLTLV
jgi:hypothetical protein